MPPLPPVRRQQRAILAARHRWHPDDPALVEQHRDFRVASAEAYIRELVATDPPPTTDQRDRLAKLLRGEVA